MVNHEMVNQGISFIPSVDIRDGEILLYGRSDNSQNIPPEQRVGARISTKDRCTRCGKPFLQGQHVTFDLVPNMAGTGRHTDCADPCMSQFDEA